MKMYVENIQIGNKALSFIDKRIKDNNYRGSQSSEHNRYDLNEIFHTLALLDKFSPNKALLRIRDTDLSKRPYNTPEEYPYASYCEAVKKQVGKGSQDSIRKNIFVDLHRMGLIKRYDKHKDLLSPYERRSAKYVSLSQEGLKLVQASTLLDRAFIFTKAINTLLGGYIDITLHILREGIDSISKYEFMFFVSAINTNSSFSISVDECIDLIREYRLLSPIQQKQVVETLKQELNPRLFAGNKTKKRDWHNWQNKIDQMYCLFRQTPHFDVSGKNKEFLSLSTNRIKTKSGEIIDHMKRSLSEKYEYYQQHHISKTPGFELHHVVPLSWAESAEQFKLFDKWENMVYIDGHSHAKITQNGNRNILMSPLDNDNLILSDNKNTIPFRYNTNILYDPQLRPLMLKYNEELRNTM